MPARVLIIEDNRDHLELMAYLLRAFGYTPLSAGWGEAGLGVALTQSPDLIICDLMLPRTSGFAVARELKSNPILKNVPIVAVSALGGRDAREKAAAAGFDGYIPKPIVPETFADQIAAFLKPAPRSTTPPSLPPPTRRPEARSEPLPQQGNEAILAVDDRQANLDLLRSMLEPLGYRVSTAGGVQEALGALRANLPDLLLTDVHMGDGTGFDLLAAINEDPGLGGLPFIVTSATYLEADLRAEALGLNETNFMLAPIEPQTLIERISARLREGKKSQGASEGGND